VAVELSVRAALRDVERATKARQRADVDAGEAQERQAVAIRAALAAGVPVADIAGVTGLTAARIYQIRDGRR
jgi:hypothetical protein